MGACNFQASGYGSKPEPIFEQLREKALCDYGHRGYTGTIAEKYSFSIRRSEPMTQAEAQAFIREDQEHNEKWGPAYAIPWCDELDRTKIIGWIFYGYASE
jgi:hypothetical protein